MPDSFDLFVSYAHSDDDHGWVTAFVDALQARHRAVALRDLDVFLDHEAIPAMSRWEDRIQQALKSSKIMLAIVSPAYFASEYCRREWQEFVEYQESRPAGGDSIAPIYIATAPAYEETISVHGGRHASSLASKAPGETSAYRHAHRHPAANAEDRWLADLCARQNVDVREWFGDSLSAPGGPQSVFQRADVQARLDRLDQDIEAQLQRQARALAGPSTVPPHNPNFVGRREELRALRTALATAKNGAVAVIQGLAGMGKSALAFEYAHAYADDYVGGRFLVPCAHVSDVRAPLVAMAELFGVQLSSDERKDLGLAYRRLRLALESGERRLLVFDNVDDPQMLSAAARAEWLGSLSGAQPLTSDTGATGVHVLATTRLESNKLSGLAVQSLDALTDDEAVDLLVQRRKNTEAPIADDEELAAAESVAQRLGGYPLALETVSVYLAQYPEVTVSSYDEWLAEEHLAALDATLADDAVQLSSLELCRSRDQQLVMSELLAPTLALLTPPERLAIEYAAYLAPDCVPLPWLQAATGCEYLELLGRARPGRPDPWRQVVRRLTGLRLLTMTDTPEIAQINRLIAAVIRALLGDAGEGRRATLLELVMDHADQLAARRGNSADRWAVEASIQLGLRLLDEGFVRQGARLTNLACLPWVRTGRAVVVAEPLERALAGEERALKVDGVQGVPARSYSELPEYADTCFELGAIAHDACDTDKARRMLRRAVEVYEALGETAASDGFSLRTNAYGLLANLEKNLGNVDVARELLNKAIAVYEKSGQTESPGLAVSLCVLAFIENDAGRPQKAGELYRQAIAIDEKALGPESVAVAALAHNLASVEAALGHPEEALALHEKALAIWQKTCDPDDPQIAIGAHGLAALYTELGRYDEAKRLLQQAAEVTAKAYSPTHPNMGHILIAQADLDRRLGRPAEAKRRLEQARAICVASGAIDRVRVLDVDVRLSELDYEAGALDDAENRLTGAMAALTEMGDVGATSLLDARFALARVRFARGDSTACARVRELWATWRESLGDDDQTTQRAADWLDAHDPGWRANA